MTVVQLRPTVALSDFDRFIDAYPRKQFIGEARRAWIWALAATHNDAEVIISGARSCAVYHAAKGTDLEFIPRAARWLQAEGWRDIYELPKRDPEPSYDRQAALREKAKAGNRFCADLLRRDYGE